jgi:CDP-glucose 4,6-dehydratase
MNFAGFYRGKRVLVTGHTGFKGGWLSLWLKSLGAEVIGLALPAPAGEPAVFQAARVGDAVRHIEADIRDASAVHAVFAECTPQIVFHLAAQSLVRQSYHDPLTTYGTNVQGTAHVLEAARNCPDTKSAAATAKATGSAVTIHIAPARRARNW